MPAAELMACKRMGAVLDLVGTVRDSDDDGKSTKLKF